MLLLLFVIGLLIIQITAGFSSDEFIKPKKEEVIVQEKTEETELAYMKTPEGTLPSTEGQIIIDGIIQL